MAKREREITENASLLKVNKQKPERAKRPKNQKGRSNRRRKSMLQRNNLSPDISLTAMPFRPLGPSPVL